MKSATYEFFLHFWGGSEPHIARDLGIKENIYYFNSKQERDDLMARLKPYEKHGLVYDLKEGEMTHKRTIANVVLRHNGHTYGYEHDFGYEYEPGSVEYMYEDGNYGCDCNRSAFIAQMVEPTFEKLDCGHTIELVSLTCHLKP